MARITEAYAKDLINQVQKEEISFSRMVELLNKRARAKVNWTNYTCPNCKELQKFGKDEDIVAGYCRNCGHPVWNDVTKK